MAVPDLSTMTDADLEALRVQVFFEQERRVTVATAPTQTDRINQRYVDAVGRKDGTAWTKPVGAFDAYPAGSKVTKDGKTWRSLIAANVWPPGDTADPQSYRWWKDLTAAPTSDAWDGNAHAYKVGDIVTFKGSTYKCLQAHESQPGWDPVTVASLWTKTA